MPQLNPTPWFIYLLLAWLIILFLAPSKILGHINLSELSPKYAKTLKYSWAWPWR
uniref:ATP synthase complex subunit 8 n=1 Tax=Amolops chunganensis TaxID=325556 RepID=A0A7U0FMM3_AMOCU|nr:ATP synthase F0 subunit 8 [Amolops chunganensis]